MSGVEATRESFGDAQTSAWRPYISHYCLRRGPRSQLTTTESLFSLLRAFKKKKNKLRASIIHAPSLIKEGEVTSRRGRLCCRRRSAVLHHTNLCMSLKCGWKEKKKKTKKRIRRRGWSVKSLAAAVEGRANVLIE